jgi:hypothetical protein
MLLLHGSRAVSWQIFGEEGSQAGFEQEKATRAEVICGMGNEVGSIMTGRAEVFQVGMEEWETARIWDGRRKAIRATRC